MCGQLEDQCSPRQILHLIVVTPLGAKGFGAAAVLPTWQEISYCDHIALNNNKYLYNLEEQKENGSLMKDRVEKPYIQ